MESSPPPLPLNYATVPTRDRSLAYGYQLLLSIVVTLSTALLLGTAGLIAPRFVGIFKDFKTELPVSTKFVIALSDWIGPGWGWCIVLLLAVVIVAVSMAIDAYFTDVRPVQRYVWIMAAVLLMVDIVWMMFFVWALFAPMLSLLDAASGRPSGRR